MAVTALSGTSGALYYKPAGTTGTFVSANVDTTGTPDTITTQTFLNFRVGDPVRFRFVNSQTGGAGAGTLPQGLAQNTTYLVTSYTANSGALQISNADGTAVTIADGGTLTPPNQFEVVYFTGETANGGFAPVGQVREWSFEINRSEIDVTTIGATPGALVPFRTYISGFAEGSGSATIYTTNEDAALSNRMIQDVLQRQQVGCAFRLYTDQVFVGGALSTNQSRSISFDAVLLSASLNVNPDDAQSVSVTFRPSGAPTFDWSTTA